jgi:tetratricopeptide (TPR) repeat protein
LALIAAGIGYGFVRAYLSAGDDPSRAAKTAGSVARTAQPSQPSSAPAAPPASRAAAGNEDETFGEQVHAVHPAVGMQEIGLRQLDLARELLEARDFESGLEAYETAAELYPSAETLGALGGIYFKLAATNLAYIQFRKAVEFDPYNADLWIDLANAEHLRTAVGHSWRALNKAREVEPGIEIVRAANGFYERAETDAKSHTSHGSFTQRRIP